MKKIIIAVVVGIASFAAGLAGVYYAMPSIAPDRVEQALNGSDSLSAVAGDSARAGAADAPRQPASLSSAFRVSGPLLDSLLHASGDSLKDMSSLQRVLLAALEDSISTIQGRLNATQRSRDSLQQQLAQLQEQNKRREALRGEAASLGTTLAKLDGKELRAILQQLDMEILEVLYAEATERNRTKMLQNMPPESAARFLQRMIRPGSATPTTQASDRAAKDSSAVAKQ